MTDSNSDRSDNSDDSDDSDYSDDSSYDDSYDDGSYDDSYDESYYDDSYYDDSYDGEGWVFSASTGENNRKHREKREKIQLFSVLPAGLRERHGKD